MKIFSSILEKLVVDKIFKIVYSIYKQTLANNLSQLWKTCLCLKKEW